MNVFNNLESKLEELRTKEFYIPYVDTLKKWYEIDKASAYERTSYKKFAIYDKNGSRKEYEKVYFDHRKYLSDCAILSLIYPDNGEYFSELCESIWEICSEPTWVQPAHFGDYKVGYVVDLFSTETAFYLAEIYTLFENRLPQKIKELILFLVNTRVFDAYEGNNYFWDGNEPTNNWSAVCCGSLGMAYMYLAPERFEKVKPRIMKGINAYIDCIGNDGCVTEGISYWYYGFWYYLIFADGLYHYTAGKEDIRFSDKVKNIVMFHQNVTLRNNVTISFADGEQNYIFIHFGLYSYLKNQYVDFECPKYMNYKEYFENISEKYIGLAKPSWVIRDFLWSDEKALSKNGIKYGVTYFDDAQWYIVKRERYSFVAKAGHNKDSHNHNDVGHFIIATDNGQMLCDIGAVEYTKNYFTDKYRYQMFAPSSFGHSVPIIDGKAQGFGREYSATNVCVDDNIFSMELQGAYDTDMVKVSRKFEVYDSSIILTDTFGYISAHSIKERFITMVKPVITEKGVKIGDVLLKTNDTPTIEQQNISGNYKSPLETLTAYSIDFDVTDTEFKAEFIVI